MDETRLCGVEKATGVCPRVCLIHLLKVKVLAGWSDGVKAPLWCSASRACVIVSSGCSVATEGAETGYEKWFVSLD